ncbi:hypothetical protein V3C99_012478, partial [Haemonchus contortus]
EDMKVMDAGAEGEGDPPELVEEKSSRKTRSTIIKHLTRSKRKQKMKMKGGRA